MARAKKTKGADHNKIGPAYGVAQEPEVKKAETQAAQAKKEEKTEIERITAELKEREKRAEGARRTNNGKQTEASGKQKQIDRENKSAAISDRYKKG